MIRFNFEPLLKTEWEPILTHQLHLILSPVLVNIKFANINVHMQPDHVENLRYFCCEFQGYGAHNEIYYAFSQNSDGKIAIRDALSRIRRTIIRKHQHARLRANVIPISVQQTRSSVLSDL